jgi:hypothetical protein
MLNDYQRDLPAVEAVPWRTGDDGLPNGWHNVVVVGFRPRKWFRGGDDAVEVFVENLPEAIRTTGCAAKVIRLGSEAWKLKNLIDFAVACGLSDAEMGVYDETDPAAAEVFVGKRLQVEVTRKRSKNSDREFSNFWSVAPLETTPGGVPIPPAATAVAPGAPPF